MELCVWLCFWQMLGESSVSSHLAQLSECMTGHHLSEIKIGAETTSQHVAAQGLAGIP